MPDLLAVLDAFLQEHRRCGNLKAGREDHRVWMACDYGAELIRRLDELQRADQQLDDNVQHVAVRQ